MPTQVDPRLNAIDDCLYRVAIRVLVVHDNKILLVQEIPELWWAFPGGGVDHGETIESSIAREIEEELGVAPAHISSDYALAHYTIGQVVGGVPRMNLYYKVSLPPASLGKTAHIAKWHWFTKDDFLQAALNPSYDKTSLARVIFAD